MSAQWIVAVLLTASAGLAAESGAAGGREDRRRSGCSEGGGCRNDYDMTCAAGKGRMRV